MCCYMRVRANNANDNSRRIHLAFVTHKWNVVISNVTSFLAPNPDLRNRWNVPLDDTCVRGHFVQIDIQVCALCECLLALLRTHNGVIKAGVRENNMI